MEFSASSWLKNDAFRHNRTSKPPVKRSGPAAQWIGNMKKQYVGVVVAPMFMLLILRYVLSTDRNSQSYRKIPEPQNRSNPIEPVNMETVVPVLFASRNLSGEQRQSLSAWKHLTRLVNYAHLLPNGIEAIEEAGIVWKSLMDSIKDGSSETEKQCPHFLNFMNLSGSGFGDGFKMRAPCGLSEASAITVIGAPGGDFRIELLGEANPGEPDPPIILHYNVRIHGDNVTENSVIVQNTWTASRGWGEEERCPSPYPHKNKKVDELEQCDQVVSKDENHSRTIRTQAKGSRLTSTRQEGSIGRKYFPFKQGYPSVSTLRFGSKGIHMSVDGKHITSFAYRETLEPWIVSEVKISGDLKLISVKASGLPASEDVDRSVNLEVLKAIPISPNGSLDLFIGVFSTANNFKRRMTVRRTWMQYPAVRLGMVAVRFFVGLHKNKIVNEQLWNEAKIFGDVQLMPFIDYYNLITWKTLAICIFGTKAVSAKYIMKTDDDAFVRIDEVMASLSRINATAGLLYGRIESDSKPERNPDSKWYISPEEWHGDTYPPWAHGPGYAVSHDIADAVYERYKEDKLKMFKLEDVGMGIWISDMKNETGLNVRYENNDRIFISGCGDQFVVAHYQGPREMLCLWRKLQESKQAVRCRER